MKWNKCSDVMPGQEYDVFYNEETLKYSNSGFLLCYHDEDCYPFLCRGYLEN